MSATESDSMPATLRDVTKTEQVNRRSQKLDRWAYT